MATIITHPIIPLVAGAGFGFKKITKGAVLAGIFLSVAPDLDVISFRLGIPYSHILGHRGLSHSLILAFLMAGIFTMVLRVGKEKRITVFSMLAIAVVSHSLLDAMTNGGLGIAFFAPFSNERYFLPWQILQVSPIGLERFLRSGGLAVIYFELIWIWIPALLTGIIIYLVRKGISLKAGSSHV